MKPEIETDRLLLRPFRPEDAEDVFAYARNPNVLRYTTGSTPTTLAETQRFVNLLINKSAGDYAFAVNLKGSPRVIGAVEFSADEPTGAVDYALAEEYWNKGLMTEAVRAVLDWGFLTHPTLERVTSTAVTANKGSRRVMEKSGMTFQRCVQEKWQKLDGPVELAVYTISRGTWQKNRPTATQA